MHAIEVTRRGGLLVLLAGTRMGLPVDPPQLLYRARLGQQIVLDAGAIDPASIAISRNGTRAYWLKDGLPATTSLP